MLHIISFFFITLLIIMALIIETRSSKIDKWLRASRASEEIFFRFPLKTLNSVNSLWVNHILIDATDHFICSIQNNHDLNHEPRSCNIFINYYKQAERAKINFRVFRQNIKFLSIYSLMINHLLIDATCYSIRNTRNKLWPWSEN